MEGEYICCCLKMQWKQTSEATGSSGVMVRPSFVSSREMLLRYSVARLHCLGWSQISSSQCGTRSWPIVVFWTARADMLMGQKGGGKQKKPNGFIICLIIFLCKKKMKMLHHNFFNPAACMVLLLGKAQPWLNQDWTWDLHPSGLGA